MVINNQHLGPEFIKNQIWIQLFQLDMFESGSRMDRGQFYSLVLDVTDEEKALKLFQELIKIEFHVSRCQTVVIKE